MSRLSSRTACVLAGTLLATALPVQGQVMPAANVPKAAAEGAQAAFRKALFEAQNVGGDRAVRQVELALRADPQYGLAKIYQAVVTPGLTGAEREQRIAAGLGTLGSASPAELLLVTYWRENAGGRGVAALPVIRAAAELAPSDAEINYVYNNAQRAGKQPAEQVALLKAFLQRFPNHAAGYNALAYTAWRAADGPGALAAAEKYVQLAPDHPNSHDTYADILLLLGRGREAMAQTDLMRRADPQWAADYKVGTIALTMGDVKSARTAFETALRAEAEGPDRIEGAYWLMATELVAGNPKGAIQQLTRIADVARSAGRKGPEGLAHDRLAVVEAYVGARRNVSAHLQAAQALSANDGQKAAYLAHSAIALSRLGQAEEARTAAQQFATLAPANVFVPSLDALLALDRKDYAAAEAALAKAPAMDVLPRALRAELLIRTGRKAEGGALRKELMSASLKQDGNPVIEFTAVVGRLRLQAL